jgi:mono/diheme cytochrome c family protein
MTTVIVLLLVAALGAVMFIRATRHGLSALDEPTRIEHVLARAMRHYATPSDLRERKNPLPLTPEVLAEGRAHFADHCATCHGNDGKGQTAMGPKFYPRVPDMTLGETQSQSDGALFATIENGIRLTGMPGWGDGTAESARGSWALVHFIRHLPKITEEEIPEMARLNPRTLAEWETLREEESFLAGGEDATRGAPPAESQPHHH